MEKNIATRVDVSLVKEKSLFSKNKLSLLLFLGPFLLFFVIFHVTPLLGGLFISFTDFPLLGEVTFVGLENYMKAFKDPLFHKSLINTFAYVIGIIPLFVLSMLAALSIQKANKGRRFFQVILFLPYIIPMAVNGFIFSFMYMPNNGVLGGILRFLGFEEQANIGLLTQPSTALVAVVFVWVYIHLGYIMSILYNGLEEIPSSYYEAAKIDGAGKIRTFFQITLPLLSNVLLYVVVTSFILAFQIFPLVWILTGSGMGEGAGGPAASTISLDLYIYQSAFRDQALGYASALGVLMLIVTFLIALIPFKSFKEVTYD
ncbi:carbohydrate ABC transporter permease [Bacillus sp. Marseille-P3661]|uniref:carbohydrate ABC transporter permease n=1 Tax=Bacillus sp. Marseille-P3661 TaxID=1936234 RepID=UPI000C864B77|nr:sugar ABC transporter permease [Bacillus sp. Marseille-P3661]